MKVWIDFTNPPHVNFYYPIIEHLKKKGVEIEITAREFVETTALLSEKGIQYKIYGRHGGNNKLRKILYLIDREFRLLNNVSGYTFSFSSNYEAPLSAWLKRKQAIVFDDNDISPNWLYAKFADYVISPKFINTQAMYAMGIKKDQLICYNGFKEDLYIASYSPDPHFLKKLPFSKFITVRPENTQASYMPSGVKSIVPKLLTRLRDEDMNVLYLPRYKEDHSYAENMDHVYIPSKPLNGLDVCYYSDAVLTGAGTFSREAALMGTKAVSFYAGNIFLSVDQYLFEKKSILHTRKVEEIIEYIRDCPSPTSDLSRSKQVKEEIFRIIDSILDIK